MYEVTWDQWFFDGSGEKDCEFHRVITDSYADAIDMKTRIDNQKLHTSEWGYPPENCKVKEISNAV